MIINQSMFDKLSKDKKKEFLERKEKVLQHLQPFSLFTTSIYWTLGIFALMLIVLPLWKLAFGNEVAISLAHGFFTILRIMPTLIAVGLIFDLLEILMAGLKVNRIKKEYFDIQVKIKPKRNN